MYIFTLISKLTFISELQVTSHRPALSTNCSTDEDLLRRQKLLRLWSCSMEQSALRCDDVTLLTFRARLKAALFNT